VQATDDLGRSSTDPTDAPLELESYSVGFVPPPLFINEFMAQNTGTIPDDFGEYEDWVEIYNAGPQTVALGGLTLSDNLANPNKYVFPDTSLAAGEFLLVWCDNDPLQGPYHADFRLSAGGEEVGLFGSAVTGYAMIDSITFVAQQPDTSLGRNPDGGAVWQLYPISTPGFSNTTEIGVPASEPTAPRVVTLGPIHPNPLEPRARLLTVPFALPTADNVTLRIFDVSGRTVRRLAHGRFEAGLHQVTWDAVNERGARVASGIYFVRLDAGAESRRSKLVLIR